MTRWIGIAALALGVASCDHRPENSLEFEKNLRTVLENRPTYAAPAAALMKDGLGGQAWLATVHGYPNNLEVCQQLIEPYNSNPELSALPGSYSCREIIPQT
jgi:hypothetical protein